MSDKFILLIYVVGLVLMIVSSTEIIFISGSIIVIIATICTLVKKKE